MVDHRFFKSDGPLRLSELLERAQLDRSVIGAAPGDLMIEGADELDAAVDGEIAFAAQKKYATALQQSNAGLIFTTEKLAEFVSAGTPAIYTVDPHGLFVRLLEQLFPAAGHRLAIRPDVDELGSPKLEENVSVGPGAVIGSGVEIGRDSIVAANCVIGPGVAIGRNCEIGPGVSIECSYVGDNVVIHAGARVGAQGFGWLDHGKTNKKIPQLGRAIIQSNAEIGPNSTVDRGALGDTVIGEGTKLGGLVEIGHNSRIGRYCLIAPTTGLSGGTIVGDSVLIGAGVGTSGHLSIGSGSVVYGRAAVTKDWPENSQLCGAPAQDIKDFWRELAVLRKLRRTDGGKA